jgi:lysyl-tRNA synthetase class 2
MLACVRTFFAERGVLEVETPSLSAGGVTDPQIESLVSRVAGMPGELYLTTSPEFAMKRLLAAGSGDIYQLSKVFRDGERGRWHNPEFTLLEWYRIGFDDAALMIDRDAKLDLLMGLAVGPQLGREGPCFICDYPASQASLARLKPGLPRVAARFELYLDGIELCNGFHELANPAEQRARFEQDLATRRARGQVEPRLDERLLAALEAGMPDCAGVALGFDRLAALALGATRLSEVMAFSIENA